MRRYLRDYEGNELKESQRRILLGVKTADANLLDKAIHQKKLKREKIEYKKTLQMGIGRSSTLFGKDSAKLLAKSTTLDINSQILGVFEKGRSFSHKVP